MKSIDLVKNIAVIAIAGSFLIACSKEEPVMEAPAPEPEVVEEVAPMPEPEVVAEPVNPLNVATQAGLDEYAGDRVHFDYDSSELTAAARSTLEKQAEWLEANGYVAVAIEGHADERGTREYNLALGERRAVSVKNYLVAMGVSSNRMETISYGKERPVAVGNDESAWGQNRRGVMVVR